MEKETGSFRDELLPFYTFDSVANAFVVHNLAGR